MADEKDTTEPPKARKSPYPAVIAVMASAIVVLFLVVYLTTREDDAELTESLAAPVEVTPAEPEENLAVVIAIRDEAYKATLADSGGEGDVAARMIAESTAPIIVDLRMPDGTVEEAEITPEVASRLQLDDEVELRADGTIRVLRRAN